MGEHDWGNLAPADVEERVNFVHQNIISIRERCFPLIKRKIRSTDDLWIDDAVRKKITQRKSAFRSAGGVRTRDWKELKAESVAMIAERKRTYYEHECKKLT